MIGKLERSLKKQSILLKKIYTNDFTYIFQTRDFNLGSLLQGISKTHVQTLRCDRAYFNEKFLYEKPGSQFIYSFKNPGCLTPV